MCGIAGSINLSMPVDQVQALLKHRGPDEQTAWQDEDGSLQFIHSRLAIQDLTQAGRQPMHHQGIHIMFNGEIYNHLELRKKFEMPCVSHSDTETLLHLYSILGTDMLHELDGMFAMAIYNEHEKKLWLCRDRAGEKPLYFRSTSQYFVFASELNVLTTLLKPQVKSRNIANFLSIGYMPIPETPYEDIVELEPGHMLTIDIPTMKIEKRTWWHIAPFYEQECRMSLSEALDKTDALLHLSVKRRLLTSDREVGTFLSGGIDSGLVTAIATRYTSKLKTYTVSFEGLFDEAPLAAKAAQALDTDHHSISINLDHLDQDLEQLFANYGEPIMDDSIIPSYYVAREAKRHLTVVLNGDAGDELFGGYRRYVPATAIDLFGRNKLRKSLGRLSSYLPVPGNKMSKYGYLHRLLHLLTIEGAETYFGATTDLLSDDDKNFIVKPDLRSVKNSLDNIINMKISSLKRMMLMDFQQILPAILLVKMDIATMRHGLESRSPFLSKELLQFAPTLQDHYRIKNFKTKYLLRQLALKYLPPDFYHQPKRGFEVPLKDWVDTKLKMIIHDYIAPHNSYVKEILKPGYVDLLLGNKIATLGGEKRAKILFALLALECWSKNYPK